MLTSFSVSGFRVFSKLTIERLGRVNLIVGKNNTGKTTLLEALRIYADGGAITSLRSLLRRRQEFQLDFRSDEEQYVFSSLFNGRNGSSELRREFRLGPTAKSPNQVVVALTYLRRIAAGADTPGAPYRYEEVKEVKGPLVDVVPGFVIRRNGDQLVFPLDRFERVFRLNREPRPEQAFISAAGADDSEVAMWWDAITLRDAERRVVECLRAIAPIERINLVKHPFDRSERMFMVRLSDHKYPVPLKSLGDGVTHMFQIAVALEYTGRFGKGEQRSLFPELMDTGERPNLLLIDEFENGIHYTVLPKLWSFVFRLAKVHGVQIFATSHSWDCIEAFQVAAEADPGCDGMLIRLEHRADRPHATLFDEDELSVVTREKIEIR